MSSERRGGRTEKIKQSLRVQVDRDSTRAAGGRIGIKPPSCGPTAISWRQEEALDGKHVVRQTWEVVRA